MVQYHKFMMLLNKGVYLTLEKIAKQRGITVQEYIRAIVVPQHLEIIHSTPERVKRFDNSMRARRGWETRRKNQESAELQAKTQIPYPGESA